jgi:large subunit ribosomal protein L18
MDKLKEKSIKRLQRKKHVRKRVTGTADRPRMSVYRSNKNISVQVIDDVAGRTLISASSLEKEIADVKPNIAGGDKLGQIIGNRLKEAKIDAIVFDRNGYLYHGVVKAIADGTRKAGIKF